MKVALCKHSGPVLQKEPSAALALRLPTCARELWVQHVCFPLKAANVTVRLAFKEQELTATVLPFILHPHHCNHPDEKLCARECDLCVCPDPEDLAFPLLLSFIWMVLLQPLLEQRLDGPFRDRFWFQNQPFYDTSVLFVVFQTLMNPLLQSRWYRLIGLFQTGGFTG